MHSITLHSIIQLSCHPEQCMTHLPLPETHHYQIFTDAFHYVTSLLLTEKRDTMLISILVKIAVNNFDARKSVCYSWVLVESACYSWVLVVTKLVVRGIQYISFSTFMQVLMQTQHYCWLQFLQPVACRTFFSPPE